MISAKAFLVLLLSTSMLTAAKKNSSNQSMGNLLKRHKKKSSSGVKSSSSGVKSTSPKCDRKKSHQCCWVVRSWNLMKKEIPSGISANDNSCCTQPMAGVTCNPQNNTILMIEWSEQELSGSIPKEIGKLTSLQTL